MPASAAARRGRGGAPAWPRHRPGWRAARAYGRALAPLAPLVAVVALLAGVAVRQPDQAPPAAPTRWATRSADAAPTAVPTPLGVDLALRERALGRAAGPRWLVVADTGGAGVFLRNTPDLADRKLIVPEGALVVELAPSPDPAWRRVSLPPDGPSGWVPDQYLRLVP